MGDATASPTTLAAWNDVLWPPSGDVAFRILLSDAIYSGTWTVDPTTDLITTDAANGWVTGQRVRTTTSGVLPALATDSLNTATDYFWIRDTDTTGYLADSLANAEANSYFNFTDAGTGTHTLSEQTLLNTDPIAVLVNKEITHPDYSRKPLSSLGNATAVGSYGEKNPVAHSYTVSSDSYGVKYVLYLFGANPTVGDTAGDKPMLETLSSTLTIDPSNPYTATTIFRTRNAA